MCYAISFVFWGCVKFGIAVTVLFLEEKFLVAPIHPLWSPHWSFTNLVTLSAQVFAMA
jgi:hypothetical protein